MEGLNVIWNVRGALEVNRGTVRNQAWYQGWLALNSVRYVRPGFPW